MRRKCGQLQADSLSNIMLNLSEAVLNVDNNNIKFKVLQ